VEATLTAAWPVTAPARQSAFSRDGSLLATSDASGAIAVRSTKDWKIQEQLQHPGGATTVAFGSNGSRLFSGGYDGLIRDWDVSRHSLHSTLTGPRGTVWTIDVSPDGTKLASGGEDQIIRLWTLDKTTQPALLRGHSRNIWEVRFSPDGHRIASGSFDSDVRLWDVRTGRSIAVLRGHTQAVVGLDLSPDGKLLATGADDSTIRFWRASDGAPLRTINNGLHVDKVAFSPDGRWLASGGHARGIIGTLWHQITGGGANGDSVRLWRVADGSLVAGLPHPDDVIYVAFSRDGRWLVTSGEDNTFRLWRLRMRNT
jgi:WD40 repeat protein